MHFIIPIAHAAQAGGNSAGPAGGGIEFIVMIVVFFVLMYFMVIRPQSKRTKEHKKLLESISRGDEVITSGGLAGKVAAVGENFIQVEIADNVIVKVQKQTITGVLPKGTLKSL